MSLANLVAYHFKLPQWYWAPLTASLILKISHDQSWQRISHRFFGTIWGCLLSLIVLSFIQNKLLLCFMILPIWFFVVITFVRHYGAFVFFLTAFVTILFNLLSNFGVEVVEERVFETIVGTVSVILVILIFMPFIKKNENATPHHIHKT